MNTQRIPTKLKTPDTACKGKAQPQPQPQEKEMFTGKIVDVFFDSTSSPYKGFIYMLGDKEVIKILGMPSIFGDAYAAFSLEDLKKIPTVRIVEVADISK